MQTEVVLASYKLFTQPLAPGSLYKILRNQLHCGRHRAGGERGAVGTQGIPHPGDAMFSYHGDCHLNNCASASFIVGD